MKYERGSFITVPSREILRGLHPTAQSLYMWLCAYANETSNCFPSRATLARDAGCSESMVDNMLLLLEGRELIKRRGRKEGDRQLSNLYTVLVGTLPQSGTPPSTQYATPLPRRTNELKPVLTQPTYFGATRVEVGEEIEKKYKAPPKYPHSKEVFSWFPHPERGWEINTTELKYGELLWERGEESVRKALRYHDKHKDDEGYGYVVVKPSQLEGKWNDIAEYARRNK